MFFDEQGDLDVAEYYLHKFNDVGCRLDAWKDYYDPQVADALRKHYKTRSGFKHYYKAYVDDAIPGQQMIIFDKTIITCRSTSDFGNFEVDRELYYLRMLFDGNEEQAQEFQSIIKPFARPKRLVGSLKLVVKSTRLNSGFELVDATLNEINVDIEKHYNSDFLSTHNLIEAFMEDDCSGLVILHGKHGTGKTSYIRHIIRHSQKPVLYFSSEMAQELSNPAVIPFLMEHRESVIVLEDCEELLASRSGSKRINSGLVNILNMSDGLLGDALKMQFICTFNAPLSDIDPALMRKGRLVARYEFCDLSADKANAIIEADGLDVPVQTSPISLAELYNYEKPSFEQQSRKKIGFIAN